LKAAMSSRLPCLAICGTDSHCKKLEIMLTEFVYEEQQRDGSTYYIPEMQIAKSDEQPQPAPKAKSKAKAKPGPKKRSKGSAGNDTVEEGEDGEEEPQPKKKTKKTKK